MAKVVKKSKAKKKVVKNTFKNGNQDSKGYGRPKMSDAEKELSLKTRTQFKAILDRYLILDLKEVRKLLKAKTIPMIDLMVLQSIKNSYESGNQSQIDWLLNHSLGKPKEETTINLKTHHDNIEPINVNDLTKEELLQIQKIHEKKKNS